MVWLGLGGTAIETDHRDLVGGDPHRLVLAEFDDIAGVGDESQHIGSQEILVPPDTNHQWGVTARSDHLIRSLRIHRHQGEGPLKLIGHTTKRHQQIAAGP